MNNHYVYILLCSDNSYYVGSSKDPYERENAHNAGRGPIYTRARRPVHLVYIESIENKALAANRERQLKKWSRAKKEALISCNPEALKILSKRKR